MPKSSIAILTPRALSPRRTATFFGTSPMSALSVISRIRSCGASPLSSSARETSVRRSASCSWRTERLTLTVSGLRPPSCQSLDWRQASRNVRRPMGTIMPVSSATGMNSAGRINPLRGCSQRTSASNPTIRPLSRQTVGW